MVLWRLVGIGSSIFQALIKANVKTNVHYVLGNNSVNEALDRLKKNDFPERINVVIFFFISQ